MHRPSPWLLPFLFLLAVLPAGAQRPLAWFLETARKNAPVFRVDSLEVLAGRLALEQQRAATRSPLIYAEGGYLAAPVISTEQGRTRFLLNPAKSTTDYYGYDLSLTNGGLYRGAAVLEQPLLTAPRLKLLQTQQQLQEATLVNHTRLAAHQLEKTVIDAYLLCELTLRQEDALRQLLALLGDQTRVVSTLASNALAYQADVQLLRIETDRLNTSLSALEVAYSTRLLDLYTLCGIRDTARVQLAGSSLILRESQPSSSAFTVPFHLDSLNLVTAQQAFDLRYRPQLNFYASAGLNTAYAPDIDRRFGWQAGLRFTQVIFDGHQRRFSDRRTRLLAQSTPWQTDYFTVQNEVRKARLKSQIRAFDDQRLAVLRQQAAYDTVLLLYQRQVMQGQLSIIDYLTVLRSKTSLQQDLDLIGYNRDLLINEYNYWNW